MVALDDPAARKLYEDEEQLPRMSFGDHLDELRRRLIRALLVLVVAVAGVSIFKTEVQEIVVGPYRVQWRIGFDKWVAHLEARQAAGDFERLHDTLSPQFLTFCHEHRDEIIAGTFPYNYLLSSFTGFNVPYQLYAINGFEDIFNWMWASVLFAFVIASPYVVWQAWSFIAAGLYQKEKRLFHRYFPFMVALFVAGVLFGYFVALPLGLGVLIRLMNPDQVAAMLSIGQYFTFFFTLTCALGIVFQLPLVMVALQRVNLVTHKAFIKHWRITVLAIFLAAALITPPEPISMLMAAAPMLLLYVLGLAMTWSWRKNEPQLEVAK